MPVSRQFHTQTGLTACGGSEGLGESSVIRDCITFTNGSWMQSANLTTNRWTHVAWKSPLGIILIGNFGVGKTAELVGTPGILYTTEYLIAYAN